MSAYYFSSRIWVAMLNAVGAQSGIAITGDSLNYTINPDAPVSANKMAVYRTTIGIMYAPDSPQGTSAPSSEQRIAHLVFTNSPNSGNYDAIIKTLNFNLSQVGIHNTASRTLKVYLDNVGPTPHFQTAFSGDFQDTTISESAFPQFVVSAGTTRNVYVTLDTTDASINSRLTFSVGANDVVWSDGITPSEKFVRELPLSSRSFNY